jgi:hypothetical protein
MKTKSTKFPIPKIRVRSNVKSGTGPCGATSPDCDLDTFSSAVVNSQVTDFVFRQPRSN